MDSQAIIMAGGEGVRLRPLTCHVPKPLVPLLGEPVMGYALRLLKRHGVTDVGATLWYQPRAIRSAFGRGEKYGVQLRYYEETVPLGTAGSVKMAQDHLKGSFFVLSGDGLTDCDLTQALNFHREKGALATLVLRRVHVPLPYGVVMTEPDGKITRFIEKPVWSRVFSNLVNTGIYILEPEIFDHIPDTGAPDFGKDIFPALIEKGLPVFGFETAAYWCDVGDQKAYLMAQQALLKGETAFDVTGGWHETASIDPTARMEGECLIGKNTVIGPGAVVRASVIGDRCVVAAGAVIENACLWNGASVGEKARLSGCVLCDGAAVRREADIAAGCALGQGAVVGAHARLLPGVKIWPHLKAAASASVSRSLINGDAAAPQWTRKGACCDTPEDACALSRAFARAMKGKQVITGFAQDPSLQAIVDGALAAGGARVLSAGAVTAGMLQMLVRALRLDGAVYAAQQQLQFFDGHGQPLTAKQKAAIDQLVLRPEASAAFAQPGAVIRFTGAEDVYLALVLPEGEKPLYSPVAVFGDDHGLLHLVERGLKRMHCRDVRTAPVQEAELRPGETGFVLADDGEGVSLFTPNHTLTSEQKTMLLLYLFQKENGVLYDLSGVPRAAEKIAPLLPADGSDMCFAQSRLMTDGLAAVFFLCHALKRGPLETIMKAVPETHIQTREIDCRPQDKARILHALC
ncbi:MAG: NTP transferase domain-containing protein, partial [Clostridia bacterium]|nr:NTP transferase domain-containing protein [Clostridia bacterium]